MGPRHGAEAHGGHPHQDLRRRRTCTACSRPYDGLSLGIIAALKGNGYGTGGKTLPVVTGQDAEVQSVKSILADEQYSTIFKDTRDLAKVTVDMIKAIGAGEEPEVNDTETYDNGVKVVPSYLLDPVTVDQGQRRRGPGRLRLLHRGRDQAANPSGWGPGSSARAPSRRTGPASHGPQRRISTR